MKLKLIEALEKKYLQYVPSLCKTKQFKYIIYPKRSPKYSLFYCGSNAGCFQGHPNECSYDPQCEWTAFSYTIWKERSGKPVSILFCYNTDYIITDFILIRAWLSFSSMKQTTPLWMTFNKAGSCYS